MLLISDMAGYGKVALSVMIPVLSYLKMNVSSLPTALVSNTLDYGKFDILETTGFMERTLDVWKELGFAFDALFVGFLFSEAQSQLVRDFCAQAKGAGAPVFFDPIMGDWGSLYNGVSEQDVAYRRALCPVADVIVPNMTEAQFLCGRHIGKTSLSFQEAAELVEGLRLLGSSSIVITSLCVEGRCCTLIAEPGRGEFDFAYYDEVPLQMPGTGDIFSSALMGAYLQGASLARSVRFAMGVVSRLLERCFDAADCLRGIPVEVYLGEILSEGEVG